MSFIEFLRESSEKVKTIDAYMRKWHKKAGSYIGRTGGDGIIIKKGEYQEDIAKEIKDLLSKNLLVQSKRGSATYVRFTDDSPDEIGYTETGEVVNIPKQ